MRPGDPRQHLQQFVVALRDRGVRPVTVNTWLRALNAFCRWLHEEGTLRERVVPGSRLKNRTYGLGAEGRGISPPGGVITPSLASTPIQSAFA